MKKIFTIIIAFVCFGFIANAQTNRITNKWERKQISFTNDNKLDINNIHSSEIRFPKQKLAKDSAFLVDSAYYYSWDTISNMWGLSSKQIGSYDDNGNATEFIQYNWESSTNKWILGFKYNYNYDSNGNITEFNRYSSDFVRNFVTI